MAGGAFVPSAIGYAIVAAALGLGLSIARPVAVTGGSMSPALEQGDVVLVRFGAGPSRGDIVLIRQEGHGPVLHRVVAIREGGRLVTRGDANPTVDARPVEPCEVRGTVVGVLPVGSVLGRWRGGGNRATLSTQSNTARR